MINKSQLIVQEVVQYSVILKNGAIIPLDSRSSRADHIFSGYSILHGHLTWDPNTGICQNVNNPSLAIELPRLFGFVDSIPNFILPVGFEWHTDFTNYQVPDGYRPLLLNESVQVGDERYSASGWRVLDTIAAAGPVHVTRNARLHRTKRPFPLINADAFLKALPHEYAERAIAVYKTLTADVLVQSLDEAVDLIKKATKDNKAEFWRDVSFAVRTNTKLPLLAEEYRPMKLDEMFNYTAVSLDPTKGWSTFSRVTDKGVYWTESEEMMMTYAELMHSGYLINRSIGSKGYWDANAWFKPCVKV